MLRKHMDALQWDDYKEIVKGLVDLDRAVCRKYVIDTKTILNEPRFTGRDQSSEFTLEITKLLSKIYSEARNLKIDNQRDSDYYDNLFFSEFFSVALTLNPDLASKVRKKNTSELTRYFSTPGQIFNDVGWDKGKNSCNGKPIKISVLLAWHYYKLSNDKTRRKELVELKKWHGKLKKKIGFNKKFKLITPHRIISSIDEIDAFVSEIKASEPNAKPTQKAKQASEGTVIGGGLGVDSPSGRAEPSDTFETQEIISESYLSVHAANEADLKRIALRIRDMKDIDTRIVLHRGNSIPFASAGRSIREIRIYDLRLQGHVSLERLSFGLYPELLDLIATYDTEVEVKIVTE